jgi:hypothetical protein
MIPNRSQTLLAIAVIFLIALACALPDLSVSGSTPVEDAVLLQTMVAETVAAALSQTAQASIPLSTPTSAEPALTEMPTAGPSGSGSTLVVQDDGTTLFTDQRAGFEVTVPAGWLALRVNEQEYYDAWSLAVASDPSIQQSLTFIRSQNPNVFRLFGLDVQDGHLQSGFVTNLNIVWEELDDLSLEDDSDLQEMAAELPQSISGLQVISVELATTSGGIPIGIIESRATLQTVSGTNILSILKQVVFKPRTGSVVISLTTIEALGDVVVPPFDGMVETIKLVE